MANDITIVTRKVGEFDDVDVEVVNPWDPQ